MTTIIETIIDIDGISYELFENAFNPERAKFRRFGIRTYTEDLSNILQDFSNKESAVKAFEELKKNIEEEFKNEMD